MRDLPELSWFEQPQLILREDFDKSTPDSTVIGTAAADALFKNVQAPDAGWMAQAINAAGISTRVNNVTNHKGVWSITTGSTSGNVIVYGFTQGNAFASAPGFNTTHILAREQVVSLTSLTTTRVFVGFAGNWLTLGTQYALIFYQDSIGANWQIGTSTPAAAVTTVDTGVAATTGFHVFGFEHVLQPTESWNFFLDGALLGNISTTLPAGLLVPGGRVSTQTAATRNLLIDDDKLWVRGSLRSAA